MPAPTQNRFYSSAYQATYLPGGAASSGNITVQSVTGAPTSFPFTMLLDWGLGTQEAVSVTGAYTGSGPYVWPVTRGIDGTTAQSHAANAIAVHGVTEQDFSETAIHCNATGQTTNPLTGNTVYVHGIASTSAVVGLNETQTLTNKTLTSPTINGGTMTGTTTLATTNGTTLALSTAGGAGNVLKVTNTTASPTNPNVVYVSQGNTDNQLGFQVAGDTNYRLLYTYNGASGIKLVFGSGAATGDTDLYRSAASVLTTDTAFTAGTTITAGTGITATTGSIVATTGNIVATAGGISAGTSVGAATTVTAGTGLIATTGGITVSAGPSTIAGNIQLASATGVYAGGTGVVGLANASVSPSGTVSGGGVLFTKSGLLNYLNSAGLSQIIVGSQNGTAGAVTLTASSDVAVAVMSAPANDPVAGAMYFFQGYLVITEAATAGTNTFKIKWGSTTLTTAAIAGTNADVGTYGFQGYILFTTTSAAVAFVQFTYNLNSGAGGAALSGSSVISATEAAITGLTVSSAQNVGLYCNTADTPTSAFAVASCERIS
jgi:hypothetical protein